MCAISPNSDASAQIFRLTMQNFGIQHCANPRQLFPKSCVGSVPFIQIRRVNADSVNAILLRQPDRPLIMKCLRDNRNAAFAKHFPGANHGVQRGESGIITKWPPPAHLSPSAPAASPKVHRTLFAIIAAD